MSDGEREAAGWTLVTDQPVTHTHKLPELMLCVAGNYILFLVDSGALLSVLKALALPKMPKKSDRYFQTTGAGGVSMMEPYTTPLSCTLDDTLLSEHCPIQ